jgi:LPLT family lysophospholipid transporter-like MFS transporter
MYVIPLNAMLQRVGEQTVGTGKIVAIQNFAENTLMLAGVLAFLAASMTGVPVVWSMSANGLVLLLIVARLYLQQRSCQTSV